MTSVARKNMLCWVLPFFLWPVLCFSEAQPPPPVPTLEEFLNKAEAVYNRHAELLRHSTGTAHVRVTRSGGEEEATRLADQYRTLGFEPPKPPYDKVGNSMTVHWYTKGDQLRYDMDIRAMEGISPWTPEAVLRVSTNGKVGVYYAPLDRKAYVNQPPVTTYDLTSYLRYFDPIFPYLDFEMTIYEALRIRAKKESLYLEYADLNGLPCIRVTASPSITGDKICYISDLICWFSIDQGYAMVQLEATRRSYENNVLLNELVVTENVNYEQSLEHPDVWIMKSYKKIRKDDEIEDLSIDFEDVHLGVDVPDITFNFDGLAVPTGTPIFDRRASGKSAVYHYVPGVHVGLDRIDLAAGEIPQNPVQDSGCPEGPPTFSQDKSSASSPPISFEEVIDKSEADYLRRVELLKHSTGTARVKVKRLGGEKLAASVANQYRAIGKEPSELCTTAGNTMEVHWHTKGENLRYDIQIGKLNDMPLWEQETTKRIATNSKVGIYHVPLDKKAYVNRPSGTIGVLTGDLDYFEVDRRYGSINRRPFEGMRMMRESGVNVSLEIVSIDGVDCVHALCLFPENNDSSEKKRTEYWFAIPYNYALKRAIVTRTFYKNSLVSIEVLKTYDATYEPSTEYPDLWILKSLRQYAREYYEEELTIDFEDVHLGVDVPDATFTFEGIGVPQGTPIFDRRTSGKSAVYHYVPGVHVGLDRIDLAAGEIPQNPVQDSGCPEGPPAFSQDKSSASSPPISFEEVIDKSEADYLRRMELLKHSTGTVRVKAKHFGSVYLVDSLSHEYRAMGIEPSELRTKGGNTKEIHWHTKGENLRYDIQIGKLDEMPLWEQETIKRIATNGKIKISHDLLNGKAYVKGDLNSALNSSLGTLGNIAPDLDCFEVDQNDKNSARLPFDGMRTMREKGVNVSLETVSIDGVDCVHALCLFPEKADGSEKKITEIWFAIPCNYAIKRVIGTRTFYLNGLVVNELRETYDATYERSKEYPDLWILKSLHQYAHEMEQTKDFENVHLGVDVPDITFNFEGIGVPQGTPIFDHRTSDKSAVYHYVPGVHVGLDRIDLAAGEIPQNPVKDSGCPEGPPEKQPGVPPPASAPTH